MKKLLSIVLMLALLCGAALAETRIAVTGEGVAYVPADRCTIVLGVSELDADALTAQSTVNSKIGAIVDALKQIGVSADDIATSQISIYARYDYSSEVEKVIGYSASNTISIRTTDVEAAGSIIDAAFLAGANTLDDVSFSAQDTSAAEAECLKKAIENAKVKAEAIAGALDLSTLNITEVSEGYSYSGTVSNGLYLRDAASGKEAPAEAEEYAATELRAAMVSVTASVSVVYTAE